MRLGFHIFFGKRSMGYFLTILDLQLNEEFWLEGEEAKHLLGSRRIRLGERIEIQDQNIRRFSCEVLETERHRLRLSPKEQTVVPKEPSLKLWLHQGMIKEKALDWVLQKSVELGAAGVNLFVSDYSQPLPKGKDLDKKLQRWHRIMVEAAKQSGRALVPELKLSEENALHQIYGGPSFVFDPYLPPVPLKSLAPMDLESHLILGPEGGFSREELKSFQGKALSLGPRVLRAETAALAALALFGGFFGDLADP